LGPIVRQHTQLRALLKTLLPLDATFIAVGFL